MKVKNSSPYGRPKAAKQNGHKLSAPVQLPLCNRQEPLLCTFSPGHSVKKPQKIQNLKRQKTKPKSQNLSAPIISFILSNLTALKTRKSH